MQGTAIKPSLADRNSSLPYSQHAQAIAYKAMFHAAQRGPWFRGVVLFHWKMPTATKDRGFSPRGKLAECVVSKEWAPAAPLSNFCLANPI